MTLSMNIKSNLVLIEAFANKQMYPTFIDDAIPKDNEKVLLKVKINKEKDSLSVCTFCGNVRVKVSLIIWRCKLSNAKFKKRFEKIGTYDYFGPFMLFNKLKEYHEATLGTEENRHNNFSSSIRITGLLNEMITSESNYRLLQFDVISLYSEYQELFWNLIFRFIKCK